MTQADDRSGPLFSRNTLSGWFRKRRSALIQELLDQVRTPARMLDVGGEERFWNAAGVDLEGFDVALLNVAAREAKGARFESVVGDARDLSRYADDEFDVVFSNSVIEHVGSVADMRRMADECGRVGQRLYLQAPNYWFPVDAHFWLPGFQFLPLAVRVWWVTWIGTPSYTRTHDVALARERVERTGLLRFGTVRELFPGATIRRERFLGLTKSFIVLEGWDPVPLD